MNAVREAWRAWPPILLGTAIYAFGIHYFILPNELMEGGLTGITLLLHYAFGFPVSISTLLLNIPLFWLGWRTIGRATMIHTMIGILALALFLRLMELALARQWVIPFQSNDVLLATLYAGVTLGIGLGIVFRYGGTTGGTDIIVRLLHKRKGWRVGQMILLIDAIVITTSLLYIPKEKVLYTLVAVFIASRMIDFIAEGAYHAKACTIMSIQAEAIAKAITVELDRGVTLFPATGAYTNAPQTVVYSVVNRQEVHKLQRIAREIDPSCFLIVHDVQDVIGEGFRYDEPQSTSSK